MCRMVGSGAMPTLHSMEMDSFKIFNTRLSLEASLSHLWVVTPVYYTFIYHHINKCSSSSSISQVADFDASQ